jgi:hypothetical protein
MLALLNTSRIASCLWPVWVAMREGMRFALEFAGVQAAIVTKGARLCTVHPCVALRDDGYGCRPITMALTHLVCTMGICFAVSMQSCFDEKLAGAIDPPPAP